MDFLQVILKLFGLMSGLAAVVAGFWGLVGLFGGDLKWFAKWLGGAIGLLFLMWIFFSVAEQIDPNWCEKQRDGRFVSTSVHFTPGAFDEYKKRCWD